MRTEYAEGLEGNLSDLHSRVQTGAIRSASLLIRGAGSSSGSSRGSGAIDGWQRNFEATIDSARAFLYAHACDIYVPGHSINSPSFSIQRRRHHF
jgi:hypothetical protein